MDQPFRLVHSADLHLGRSFGNQEETLRGRLIEARHQILSRLAEAARRHGAVDIVLAGDSFDTETPSDPVWRQALTEMAEARDLRWWILPGNHDSLAAESLWARVIAAAPAHVRVLTEPAPIDLAPGVVLLPAPLPRRRPGQDLTAWMSDAATPPGTLRIGLAHGPVQEFSEGPDSGAVIAPDRARLAGLDYLALGDWHGQMRIGARTAYAGTPEAEGFRHAGRGACLAVTLAGGDPRIERVETGRFHWSEATLALVPGQDPVAALDAVLPASGAARRDHLLRLRAEGRATLAGQQALREAVAAVAPEFALFRLDDAALETEVDAADLETLDHGGALRLAADHLVARASDQALPEDERRVAAGALNRLYAYLAAGA